MANGGLDRIANRITQAAISFQTGIPQIELDRLELQNRVIDEQAQGLKRQGEAESVEIARQEQLQNLFGIITSPQSSADEKKQAANAAAVADPELLQDFFSAIGVTEQAEKDRIATRAFEVASAPNRELKNQILQRQIVEGEAVGRDMTQSKRLLQAPDEELDATLAFAQAAALTPEQRAVGSRAAVTAERQERQLGLQERGVDIQERGLELREDELTAARGLAETARVTKQTEQGLKTEEGLRKEVNTLLKDFFQVADANARVLAAGTNPSAAGDLALIFNYMKLLDPGSTVREGEFATAQNSASVPQRVRGLYNSITQGQRLSEAQREDFLARAESLFGAAQGEAQKTADAFERIATNAGVNVGNVLASFQERRRDIDRTVAPQAAIAFLRANDTPENRAQFTQKFGALPEGF